MVARQPPRFTVPLRNLEAYREEHLSIADVATILDVSENTARKFLKAEGKERLPHTRLGNLVKVHRAILVAWMNENADGVEYVDPGYDERYEPTTSEYYEDN